jgi:hypothetical protein
MQPEKMMTFLKARWKSTASEGTDEERDDGGCEEFWTMPTDGV